MSQDDEKVTLAVLRADLQHLSLLMQVGFTDIKDVQAATNVQLRALNGSVRDNRDAIVRHEQQIGSLERFRDALVKWALSGLGIGVGIGVVAFGLGKAAGWW